MAGSASKSPAPLRRRPVVALLLPGRARREVFDRTTGWTALAAVSHTGHVEKEYEHVLYLRRVETPQPLAERIVAIGKTPADERRALGARARNFMFAEKTWTKQDERLAQYLRTKVLAEAQGKA